MLNPGKYIVLVDFNHEMTVLKRVERRSKRVEKPKTLPELWAPGAPYTLLYIDAELKRNGYLQDGILRLTAIELRQLYNTLVELKCLPKSLTMVELHFAFSSSYKLPFRTPRSLQMRCPGYGDLWPRVFSFVTTNETKCN